MIRVIFALIVCALFIGCVSSRDPVGEAPNVDIQEVFLDKPCIIQIKATENAILPDYPAYDAENPKEWALNMRTIYKKREALRDLEIKTLREQIGHHNNLTPKCSE